MVRHFGLKLRMLVAGSILFGFYALIAGFALLTFGTSTTMLAIVLAGSVLFVGVQYKFGKWAALRSVDAEDMPEDGRYGEIHRQVEDLCRDMEIEKPRLMVARMGMPNAFAVGRKADGTVVVSREIIDLLDREELKGVLAHELAHIKNRDVVMMVIGQSIASMVGIAAQFAVLILGEDSIANFFLAILVGTLTQLLVSIFVLAISRYREYVADSDAAEYTHNPEAMARALEKISKGAERTKERGHGDDGMPDDVAALAIFDGDRGILATIFATHPPVEKRIEKLRA